MTSTADGAPGQDDPSSSTRFATDIVFKGVAGAVGYAIGGAAGGVIGSIGGDIFARALHLDRSQLARKVERIEQTVVDGASQANMAWEDFDAALQADPLRSELYARVLEAAGSALSDAKLKAFGRVLSAAVLDSATIDIAFIISAALADMEQPHIRALAILNGGLGGEWFDLGEWLKDRPDLDGSDPTAPTNLPTWAPNWGVESAEFNDWLPTECGGTEAFPAIVATLVRHALLEQRTVNSSTLWVTSRTGRRILSLLHPTAPRWVEAAEVERRQQQWLDTDDGNNLLEWHYRRMHWQQWEEKLRAKG